MIFIRCQLFQSRHEIIEILVHPIQCVYFDVFLFYSHIVGFEVDFVDGDTSHDCIHRQGNKDVLVILKPSASELHVRKAIAGDHCPHFVKSIAPVV